MRSLYVTSQWYGIGVVLILYFAAVCIAFPAPAFAVSNYVGIESGLIARGLSITTTYQNGDPSFLSNGGGGCSASDYILEGNNGFLGPGALPGKRIYTSSDNEWSVWAKRGACKYPIAFGITVSFGGDNQVGFMWPYMSAKKLPPETDMRICMQATGDGKVGTAQCTPWASTLTSSTAWADSAFAYDGGNKKDADTYRIKVETRALPGRSITDARMRVQLIDYGGKEAGWVATKWSSQGGGWARELITGPNRTWVPTGQGEYTDGVQVGVGVRMQNVPSADLTASSVGLNTGSTLQGNDVTFAGVVINGGDITTGVAFLNRFEYRWGASGAWITSMTAVNSAALAAGASRTLTSPTLSLSQSGALQVRLCADTGSAISELDNANNCSLPTGFTVAAPLPNLIPINPGQTGTLIEGQPFTLSGSIQNTGTGASSPSLARFCIDGDCANSTLTRIGADQAVPGLGVNGTSAHTQPWTATAGVHQTYICAVGRSCVAGAQFTVLPRPNLTPINLNRSGTPTAGQSMTFFGNIQNAAGAAGAGPSTARFCIDNANCATPLGTPAVAGISSGGTSAQISGAWTATAGSHTAWLCSDVTNAVTETNEGDNCTSLAPFNVAPAPQADLTAINLAQNGTLTEGQPLTFSGNIRNTGNLTTGASFRARFCIDNISCLTSITGRVGASDHTVSTLGAGGTSALITSSPWTAVAGTHTIRLCADPNPPASTVSESDESDNCGTGASASLTFTVTSSAFVPVVPLLSISPEAGKLGEKVTFTWDVLTNDPSLCTIIGPGSTKTTAGSITTQTGTMAIDLLGAATYTLTCPGGTDSLETKLVQGLRET